MKTAIPPMTGEASNPLYCKVAGTWTVSAGQYKSTGRDCDGARDFGVTVQQGAVGRDLDREQR
jgi:hypothetical protein